MNNKWKFLYYSIMGYVFIPERIKSIKEKKLLHISDTPVIFFDALKKLLNELSPHIIIHTGDMVDNIKLEKYKHLLPKYEQHLKSIVDILENSSAESIYICSGNHDNVEVIKKHAKRSSIIEKCSKIEVFDRPATVSHYPMKVIENPSDYNFFGHDISLGNDMINNKVYLNGISTINILTSETNRLFYLPYPKYVDDARLMKGKIGL